VSDELPLAELPLRNRNRLDRVTTVVNDHHRILSGAAAAKIAQDRRITELELTVQRLEATLARVLAMTAGTGATSTG